MSLGDLTPYQKQNSYYTGIQLGNDLKSQTELLRNQTKAMVSAQLKSTSAIIASQDRINEGIDKLAYSIDEVKEGMYGLKAAFEFGISEVVWQLEQNRQFLKNILEVLIAPLDTQAKELRRRAEEAYANGWFDDALEDFLESEQKNKYDFSVHISIGLIYLFQKVNREKAFEYFEKAVKYAKPKSQYHASFALLHAALIKRDLDLAGDAEKLSDEAVNLSPDFVEANYQNALYNALLNKPDRAIPNLKKAISIDINYCDKIHNEKAFDSIRTNVINLFDELREEKRKEVLNKQSLIEEKQTKLIALVKRAESLGLEIKIDTGLINAIERISILIKRNSYRDYLEAIELVAKVNELQQQQLSDLKQKIQAEINQNGNMVTSCQNQIDSNKSGLLSKLKSIAGSGFILLPILSALITYLRFPGTGRSVNGMVAVFYSIPLINLIALFVTFKGQDSSEYAYFGKAFLTTLMIIAVIFAIGLFFYFQIMKSSYDKNIKSVDGHKDKINKLEALLSDFKKA